MRIDRGLLGWGVFLIVLGAVPLATSQGLLDPVVAGRSWQLWPLILVGSGLGLLLRRTPLDGLGGLVVAATFGAMLGGVLAAGRDFSFPFGDGSCGLGESSGPAFASQAGTLGGGSSVELELSCGELAVTTAAGSGWTVAGTDDDGRGPTIEAGEQSLEVRSRDGGPFDAARDDWQVTLPTEATLDLAVTLNAGSGRIDLPGAELTRLGLDLNAGDLTIDLAETSGLSELVASVNAGALHITLPPANLQGGISANAGSIELCAPDGVGLRFVTQENLTAGYDFGSKGLVQNGDAWESPGFAQAERRIELEVSANAGSVSLDPVDGCDG